MRNVCLQIDVTDEEKILAHVPRAEYERALGYLTLWAKDSYKHVIIYSPYPKEGELVAVYRREEAATPPDYVIGAIWHEDSGAITEEGYPRAGHYGFHS
jgi:hypothetical protein